MKLYVEIIKRKPNHGEKVIVYSAAGNRTTLHGVV